MLQSQFVAVIQEGTTKKQRMVSGNLLNISKIIKENKIKAPSIIIIGQVVGLSKIIGWK